MFDFKKLFQRIYDLHWTIWCIRTQVLITFLKLTVSDDENWMVKTGSFDVPGMVYNNNIL